MASTRKRSAPTTNGSSEQSAPASKKTRVPEPQQQQVAASTPLLRPAYLRELVQHLPNREEVDRLCQASSVVDYAVESMAPSRLPRRVFNQLKITTVRLFSHPSTRC